MDKRADTVQPIHDLLAERWSPLAFDEARGISDPDLLSLCEAFRWAPSCFNEQPWALIVGRRGEATYDALLSCIVEGNLPWAQRAPMLALSIAKLSFDRNGKPNRHAQHDVGLASMSLVIQAEALGMSVHQMGGYMPDKAKQLFDIPDTHESIAMIAVGYQGDASTLPDSYQQREQSARSRRALADVIHAGKFGTTAPFVR